MTALLTVTNLAKTYPGRRSLWGGRRGDVRAVDGVTFSIQRGETFALIGESGCGKSTVGRLIMRLIEPSSGTIVLEGRDITRLDRAAMRATRQNIQIVFQDPSASLNPRLTAGTSVGEPLENFGTQNLATRTTRIAELFARVGLPADMMARFPFELSGGQRQRLGLARALALNPALIVADEPVSALDVSIQAQVLNLMADLQRDLGLAYLFISHDLGVVRHLAHRVAVMYLGRIVELAETDVLFATPRHPYTQALIAAAPVPDPRAPRRRAPLDGDVPSPSAPPPGCPFHPRCPRVVARCRTERPILQRIANASVACHRADEA